MAAERKQAKPVQTDVNKMIDGMVIKAKKALDEFMSFDQEKIDNIVHEMALAG